MNQHRLLSRAEPNGTLVPCRPMKVAETPSAEDVGAVEERERAWRRDCGLDGAGSSSCDGEGTKQETGPGAEALCP